MTLPEKKKKKRVQDPLGLVRAYDQQTGKTFTIDLDERVEFREHADAKEWLRAVARVYSYWASLRDVAREAREVAKLNEATTEAQLNTAVREEMRKQMFKETEIKETEIKHRVTDNAKMQSASRELIDREGIYQRLCGVISSLEEIRSNLQSYAKIYSAELGSGIGDQ